MGKKGKRKVHSPTESPQFKRKASKKAAEELSKQGCSKYSITGWKEVEGQKVPIFRENVKMGPETTQNGKFQGQMESNLRQPRIPPIVTKNTEKYSILREALEHFHFKPRWWAEVFTC